MNSEEEPTLIAPAFGNGEASLATHFLDNAPLSVLLGMKVGTGDGNTPQLNNPDNYQIKERLGKGGMGTVYRARDIRLQRDVAIKVLNNAAFATTEERQRFLAEAKAASNLHHDHIIPIWAYGESEDAPWIVMPLLSGGSLSDELKKLTSLSPQRAVKLMIPVCQAIHHAHERKILHRDLKPANILLDEMDDPMVVDFGLAKRLDSNSLMTATGTIMGTPSYMPPEQASGEKTTPLSDVYSLGAVLYHLVTGKPPFQADSPMETLRQVKEEAPPRPTVLQKIINRDLETIILKCLDKKPTDRYPSAAALAEDLIRWQNKEALLARRNSVLTHLIKWARRKPAQATIAGVTLLGLVGFIGSLIIGQIRLRAERDLTNTVRKNAEQLNGTALTDYRRTVEATVGKLDALEQITDSVGQYYAALPESLRDDAALLRQAQLFLLSGEVNSDKGDLKQAKALLAKTLDLTRPKEPSGQPEWLLVHAAALVKHTDVSLRQDDDTLAEKLVTQAVETGHKVLKTSAQSTDAQQLMGLALFFQGRVLTKKEGLANVEAASTCFAEATNFAKLVADSQPSNLRYQQEYVWSLVESSKLNKNRGLGLLTDVTVLTSKLGKNQKALASPDLTEENKTKLTTLAKDWNEQIKIIQARATPMLELAKGGYEKAAAVLRNLIQKYPWNYPLRRDLGVICDGLGDLETEWRKDLPAAFKWYSEYATLASEMVQHDERNAEWLRELAVAKKNLATTHLRMGKQDLAQTLFGEAISVRRNLVSADPTNHKNARELCLLLLDYCDTLTQLGKREDTLSILAECQTMCRQKYTEDAGEAWWENREISIWYRLAINQWGIGRSLAKANPEKPDFDYLKTVSGYLESAAIRSKELKSANRLTPTGIRESEKCAALLPAVKSSLESPLEREIPPSKDKN